MMDRSLVTLCKSQMVTLMLTEVRRPVQRVHYMNKIVVEHAAVACFIVYFRRATCIDLDMLFLKFQEFTMYANV